MISAAKRKQLEEAGYKVNKSGKTVQHPEGGTVAGINENGEFFGSGKALDILKSTKKDSDTKSREKPKERKTTTSAPKSSPSSAPTESKRPKQRQMGRGEPNYGEAEDKSTESAMGGPRRGRKPMPTRDRREGTTLLRSNSTPTLREFVLERVRESGDSSAKAQRKYRDEYKDTYGSGGYTSQISTGSSSRKSTRGMAKGGMVRKGNTSYKDKGMFYKSASPRGFK